MIDKMELKFNASSENEGFARMCAAAFAARLDPTLEEIADIKTAVSEAVTNCVVHAYGESGGEITMKACVEGRELVIEISDQGAGIENIEQAREPFFTTSDGEERSGMGFTMMETMMDSVDVYSKVGSGTRVVMLKSIG